MNYDLLDLNGLEEDVKDCEKEVGESKQRLADAKFDLRRETVRWAEAIIALDTFKKEHGL